MRTLAGHVCGWKFATRRLIFSPFPSFTMSEKQQRLVLSIIEFLNQSIADGTVKQDDREGLEVAGE